MIREFEPVRILRHPRVRALGDGAAAVYLALLRLATPSGHVSDADLERTVALATESGRHALVRLVAADLIDENPIAPGYWIVTPWTLDTAGTITPDQRVLPTQEEQWAADTQTLVAQLGARFANTSVGEWRAGMDAIANARGKL